jgi:hypothetical protein
LQAHKYLCETLKILHGDISIGNILLYRPDESVEASGLLIDFDFAKTIKDVDGVGRSGSDGCDAEGESVDSGELPPAVENVVADEEPALDSQASTEKWRSNIQRKYVWTVSGIC